MRYRALDANGDYAFGQGSANFLVNSPACVAQAVKTRLALWEGEWFLDKTDGTPWIQDVLGKSAKTVYDLAIRTRILGAQGVSGISSYSSELSPTRQLTVTVSIVTIYDSAPIVIATVVTPPSPPVNQLGDMIYIPALIH